MDVAVNIDAVWETKQVLLLSLWTQNTFQMEMENPYTHICCWHTAIITHSVEWSSPTCEGLSHVLTDQLGILVRANRGKGDLWEQFTIYGLSGGWRENIEEHKKNLTNLL